MTFPFGGNVNCPIDHMVYPINHIFPDWHSHLVGIPHFQTHPDDRTWSEYQRTIPILEPISVIKYGNWSMWFYHVLLVGPLAPNFVRNACPTTPFLLGLSSRWNQRDHRILRHWLYSLAVAVNHSIYDPPIKFGFSHVLPPIFSYVPYIFI